MKKILLSGFLAFGVTAFAQVDVTATAGTSTATYTTLAEAFTAVNSGTHQGVINISISGNTTETATATLNAVTTYTSLVIKPATGVTPTITGNINGMLVDILGSNVTIDGSNTAGGTSRDLTFSNSSVTTPRVLVMGSASSTAPLTNVNVKNAVFINGISSTSNMAAIALNNGAAGTTSGYFNNITIENNSVQNSYYGVYANATVATGNGNVTIKGNDMSTSGANALYYAGVFLQGTNGATIENNMITRSAL